MSAASPFWRRRLLPAFLVLLGLNLAAFAAWTGPRYWSQRSAASRLEAAQAEAAGRRASTAVLRERAQAIRDNTADLRRFYDALGGEEETDLLPTLQAIEEMARTPGLRPGSRTYRREDAEGARAHRVAVTLPLQGSYGQLVGFLREVQRSPRFVTVDSVSMRAGREGDTALQVVLSAYLRRTEAARKEERPGRS